MPKLTAAQRRSLSEIAAGRVVWDRFDGRLRSTVRAPAVRMDTITRVIKAGLAKRGLSRGGR